MRKVLLTIVILALTASMAFAQGRIGIFGDTAGTNCAVVDNATALLVFQVVHINSPGATAGEYAAPIPACFTGSYVSDAAVKPINLGNTQTGVSTPYSACESGNIHIMTINTFAMGTTPNCCIYPVIPHPINGLNMTDCGTPFPTKVPLPGQSGIINSVAPGCECADIVATQNSTWGGVKALWSTNN